MIQIWLAAGWLAAGEASGCQSIGAFGADAVLLISGNIPWDFNILCAP